jgi:uncharacterized protein YyaL (SSP411 family)
MTSCKESSPQKSSTSTEEESFFTTAPAPPAELSSNNLAQEPTEFLKSQADSPIHWQPFTPKVLEYAEQSQRVIFIYIGSTTYPQSRFAAEALADSHAAQINENYVPVLADTELDPSIAEICNIVSVEQGKPVSFPFALWLSHEGNPIHHFAFGRGETDAYSEQFERSHATIVRVREESTRYVVENSHLNNEKRVERLLDNLLARKEGEENGQGDDATPSTPEESENPTYSRSDFFRAAQDLASFYDEVAGDFDNTGGIPPANLTFSLTQVASHPAAPSRLRDTALSACRNTLDNLVQTPLRDPLDNYFFVRRNVRSYAVPTFVKHISTQANMLSAIAGTEKTPALHLAETKLLQALQSDPFTSRSVKTIETAREAFTWSEDSVAELLTDEEFAVAESAFQLSTLGNVSSADDPGRIYFRRNTLGLRKFGQELATATGLSISASKELLASAVKKIAAARNETLEEGGERLTENLRTLSNQALLLSALSTSQAASPSSEKLSRVQELAETLMSDFRSENGSLMRIQGEASPRRVPACAFDYATLITALLDYHAITWQPEILTTAQELTTELLDQYLDDNNLLAEQPASRRIVQFPVYSGSMIFGESTWGLALGVFNRMDSLGFEHPKLADAQATMSQSISKGTINVPLIHTDYLRNAIITRDQLVLLISTQIPTSEAAELRQSLAAPQYASIFAVTEGFASLPELGNNEASLIRAGEVVRNWDQIATISEDLTDYLSQN